MGKTYDAAIPGSRLPYREEARRSEKREGARSEKTEKGEEARSEKKEKREEARSEKKREARSEKREARNEKREARSEKVTPIKRLREGLDSVDPVDGSTWSPIAA